LLAITIVGWALLFAGDAEFYRFVEELQVAADLVAYCCKVEVENVVKRVLARRGGSFYFYEGVAAGRQ